MALCEARIAWSRALRARVFQQSRSASTATADPVQDLMDLEVSSLHSPVSKDVAATYNPIEISKNRPRQLPASKYKFRPPKYFRGPLHPHQPPARDDIASREFVPGPFSKPRLEQWYDSAVESDMLALCYSHIPPGTPQKEPENRLRPWSGDSPYLENRTWKGPRGASHLLPKHKPITFRNIPQITRVTVHSFVPLAQQNYGYLKVAGMALQSITNKRVTTHRSKKAVTEWDLKKDKTVAATADLEGEDMYDFLAKTVDLVLPRVKDWKGIAETSGDMTGNISFGLKPEELAFYPEIEYNFDMYPQEMIPGCHITIHTSAITDREARLLLSAMGFPFDRKPKKR